MEEQVPICRARDRSMSLPLAHPPGRAQIGFGDSVAAIGGVRQKDCFLCMDLRHSKVCFVEAYSRGTTEVLLDTCRPPWVGAAKTRFAAAL